jgi:hypothetical protein
MRSVASPLTNGEMRFDRGDVRRRPSTTSPRGQRATRNLAKVLGEVSLVGKSKLQGNLAQRRIGLQHVLLGPC